MAKAQKNRASKQSYVSDKQLTLVGFETPFSKNLRSDNRWVELAKKIPWDTLVSVYVANMRNESTGADGINPRVAIGSMIIKHICNLSDRETVQQIQENMYMQYFIGYTGFSDEVPFDPSLFVNFRKRLGIEQINAINEKILGLNSTDNQGEPPSSSLQGSHNKNSEISVSENKESSVTHKGKLITDATACPQDIAYPTDLNLLNDAREKSEQLIDLLYDIDKHKTKPRTYRRIARKDYLKTAQKKTKSRKEIRMAVKKQLAYLKRNIKHINNLLDTYPTIPLRKKQYKYLLVIQSVYKQQQYMYKNNLHSVEHRIVSIHQPHVRPIVRGKTNARVEFGAKINVSLMNGYAFLDELSWEAFNEGQFLIPAVENYKKRFGYYPEEVMADKIYCNRSNRAALKKRGIRLRAKPLGRPKAVNVEHVRPGERNPIEGKFGQAKTAYGMNRIKARLQQTSQSWIATIILVLNLVKLAGEAPYTHIFKRLTFSARVVRKLLECFMNIIINVYACRKNQVIQMI
jgi:hypothetical protein